MSICKECAEAAELDRKAFDAKLSIRPVHPHNCGCPCQHRPAKEWGDYFSCPRPDEKDE